MSNSPGWNAMEPWDMAYKERRALKGCRQYIKTLLCRYPYRAPYLHNVNPTQGYITFHPGLIAVALAGLIVSYLVDSAIFNLFTGQQNIVILICGSIAFLLLPGKVLKSLTPCRE